MVERPKIPPRGFNEMASAPTNETILLKTWNGKTFPAKWTGGFLDNEEQDCCCWVATEEGNHPKNWDDGVCWGSNSDCLPSEPPIGWKPL